MGTEISLQATLLSAPDFSEYNGENAFTFQEKIYRKRDGSLGNGASGEVFCFEADDHTKVAVKSELMFYGEYTAGANFQKEAQWYQKIYGLGVFSGDANDILAPHYILMPYFEGKTLYSFPYVSINEVLFCWLKTADAVKRLHEQHHTIHCDLKSDNVIFGKRPDQALFHSNDENAFVIDFGFATKICMQRNAYITDSDENRELYKQHPPEIFTRSKQKQFAHPCQDIYSLGILLFSIYQLFLKRNEATCQPTNIFITVNDVCAHLTKTNPLKRWSIAKAVFIIVTTFFSQVPRDTWIASINNGELNRLNYTNLMSGVWRATSNIAIQVRRNELEMEQKTLEKADKKSNRKAQKINGLKQLQSDIKIKNPEMLGIMIADAKEKFPELTAGVFSRRTKILLNELTAAVSVCH